MQTFAQVGRIFDDNFNLNVKFDSLNLNILMSNIRKNSELGKITKEIFDDFLEDNLRVHFPKLNSNTKDKLKEIFYLAMIGVKICEIYFTREHSEKVEYILDEKIIKDIEDFFYNCSRR